jgi:hypothetical protein
LPFVSAFGTADPTPTWRKNRLQIFKFCLWTINERKQNLLFFAAVSPSELCLVVWCGAQFASIAMQPSRLVFLSPHLAGYLAWFQAPDRSLQAQWTLEPKSLCNNDKRRHEQ